MATLFLNPLPLAKIAKQRKEGENKKPRITRMSTDMRRRWRQLGILCFSCHAVDLRRRRMCSFVAIYPVHPVYPCFYLRIFAVLAILARVLFSMLDAQCWRREVSKLVCSSDITFIGKFISVPSARLPVAGRSFHEFEQVHIARGIFRYYSIGQ